MNKILNYQELGNLMIDSWLLRTKDVYVLDEVTEDMRFVRSINDEHWKESVREDLMKLVKIAIKQNKERGIVDRFLDLFETLLDKFRKIPGQDRSFKFWIIYILVSVLSFTVLFGLLVTSL